MFQYHVHISPYYITLLYDDNNDEDDDDDDETANHTSIYVRYNIQYILYSILLYSIYMKHA